MIHRSHCALRLGDNLAALHLLRGFARAHPDRRFIHYAHLAYIHQLAEVVCDLPNLQLCDLESVAEPWSPECANDYWHMAPRPLLRSVDMWKNAEGFWEHHPLRLDYARFMLEHAHRLKARFGLEHNPFERTEDLLFDFPALASWEFPAFDCLVVNSPPQSGQLPGYSKEGMELLVGELAQRMSVWTTGRTRHAPCTLDRNMTVAQIGAMSRFCRVIVMVSTGPSWCTINKWNAETIEHRVILLHPERVELAKNTVHAANAEEARRMLMLRGVL